jgi:DNA-binding NarL/FixJ family response regulator
VRGFWSRDDFLSRARERAPAVALLEGDADDATVETISELRRSAPETRIVLLAQDVAPAVVRLVTRFEIDGVVLRSETPGDLAGAIRQVLGGRSTYPEAWSWTAASKQAGALAQLRPREREILELLAGGLRNEEIAERLFLSVNTIKFHLRSIYARLGVHNRVQAARLLDDA